MNEVWIFERHYDYEGSEIVNVYATRELAVDALLNEIANYPFHRDEWKLKRDDPHIVEWEFSVTTLSVQKYKVQHESQKSPNGIGK